MTLGEPASGQALAHGGSVLWYQVEVHAGDHVFALVHKDAGFNVYLSMAEGQLPGRASNYSYSDQAVELVAQSDGYAYVRVDAYDPGTFSLLVYTEPGFVPRLTLGLFCARPFHFKEFEITDSGERNDCQDGSISNTNDQVLNELKR